MIFNVEELLTQGEECPEGWTSLTGGCYKFLTGKRNWTEAKEECEKLPGWLVEIESEEQNDALYDEAREQKIGSSAWIGLSDTAKEGEWIWSSGEKATFLNWTPQSPSNTRQKINNMKGEDCAVIITAEKTVSFRRAGRQHHVLAASAILCLRRRAATHRLTQNCNSFQRTKQSD